MFMAWVLEGAGRLERIKRVRPLAELGKNIGKATGQAW